jgi:hypothetical protein
MLTLIVILMFPFAIWQARRNIKWAEASPSWPTVNGVVTESKRRRVLFWKQARVAYSYSVANVAYIAKRVAFAAPVSKEEIDTVLNRYPVGQAVTVHYLPENPAQAVLEPGSGPRVVAQLRSLIIIFVMLILANILVAYLRSLGM